jgi:hypothetical protein
MQVNWRGEVRTKCKHAAVLKRLWPRGRIRLSSYGLNLNAGTKMVGFPSLIGRAPDLWNGRKAAWKDRKERNNY